MKKTCKILSGSLLVALMAFGLVKGNPVEKTGGLQVRDVLAEDVTKDVAGRIVRKADGEAPVATGKISEAKAQVSEEVEGKRHIRFVVGIDSYAYDGAHFDITFKNGEEVVKTWADQRVSYVYEAVEAAGETVTAADVFGEGYNYLIAFTVNNVPQANWNNTIEVNATVETAEQKYVGTVAEKSVQGIIDADDIKPEVQIDYTQYFEVSTNTFAGAANHFTIKVLDENYNITAAPVKTDCFISGVIADSLTVIGDWNEKYISFNAVSGAYAGKDREVSVIIHTVSGDLRFTLSIVNSAINSYTIEKYDSSANEAEKLPVPIGFVINVNKEMFKFSVAWAADTTQNAAFVNFYLEDSNGNLLSGYPVETKNGKEFDLPETPGTYYGYIKAMGDGINYSDSNSTDKAELIVEEITEAQKLPKPDGFVLNYNADANNIYMAWAGNTTEKASYVLFYIEDANGNVIDGYPVNTYNGNNIAGPKEAGTYYGYIQSIGDGVKFADSDISVKIQFTVNETTGGDTEESGEVTLDLSKSIYSGGDLVYLKFDNIAGLNNLNGVSNLEMTVVDQDGNDVLNSPKYNGVPSQGWWNITLKNFTSITSITVTMSFTYENITYSGTQTIVKN